MGVENVKNEENIEASSSKIIYTIGTYSMIPGKVWRNAVGHSVLFINLHFSPTTVLTYA